MRRIAYGRNDDQGHCAKTQKTLLVSRRRRTDIAGFPHVRVVCAVLLPTHVRLDYRVQEVQHLPGTELSVQPDDERMGGI